ncbi:MAG: UDP-N-acetylmuramoyl-tripeptide--D-alanyl-D-alanine ligase [Actinomycetota bacterium]
MHGEPFSGYTLLLRTVLYGFTPAFLLWQHLRGRRALHIFQLEGYRRGRFLDWCGRDRRRALFLTSHPAKKPLVMTGRAWRLLATTLVLTGVVVLVPTGAVHVALGTPADLLSWLALTAGAFLGLPYLVVAADVLLAPVQRTINARYLRAARNKLQTYAPAVVGITGSFGKTSTKFAIAALAGPTGSVLATPASYNTPLGVARAINEGLEADHRVLVVEMGAYAVGDIGELSEFARPSIGVLTSIGPAHLERFGSLEAISQAKYELIESLPSEGVAVMNCDDPQVRVLAEATKRVRVIRYGTQRGGRPDITARDIKATARGTAFELLDEERNRIRVITRLLGAFAIGHILAAVGVARVLGRSLEELKGPIEDLEPTEHRLQLIEGAGGVTVIDDAYNSNPEGAAAALDVLAAQPGNQKVVVTPGIIELGPLQFESNRNFGLQAAAVADTLVVVGETNRAALLAGANAASDGAVIVIVDSLDAATEKLKSLLRPGDVVLFENDLPDQYES